MFLAIISLITEGLKLWNLKEGRKYIDKLAKLEVEYREEFNKPYEQRDNAALDNLEFELRIVLNSIATDLKLKNA